MSRPKRDEHTNSRTRLLIGANDLFRRFGYGGTALSAIAKEGKAPMGSVYFHFPGGKEQLAIEALKFGAERVAERMIDALNGAKTATDAFKRCATLWADNLEKANWGGGCPVAPTALQMSDSSEPIRQASLDIFEGWQRLFVARLTVDGYTPDQACDLAEQILALLEGAELLARVRRSRRPLENAARSIARLLQDQPSNA